MDKNEAEKVVNEYGGAIASSKDLFKKKSLLPSSKVKIRQAFYAYISAIIKEFGSLPKDLGEALVTTYCMLDAFVSDEDADRLNKIPEKIKHRELVSENPKDKEQMQEYSSRAINALRNNEYFDEINDFIEECYKKS